MTECRSAYRQDTEIGRVSETECRSAYRQYTETGRVSETECLSAHRQDTETGRVSEQSPDHLDVALMRRLEQSCRAVLLAQHVRTLSSQHTLSGA